MTMFSAYIRNHSRHAAAGLLATLLVAAQSCVREPDFDPREEGREAAVTLRWSPSDMTIQSRALTDEQERYVHSLWVGIYDYGSGKIKTLTDGKSVVHTDGYYLTPDATLDNHKLDPQAPLTLHTTSGESYIVAVANPDTNYGISDKVDGTTLLELLRQCDTWEKFRSVAVLTGAIVEGTTPNITLTEANMPMVGLYYENRHHDDAENPDPVNWTEEARSHTYIPAGTTTLPGTIHLRRLHAHVNFQIIPGQYITVEPTSWQVRNVPYASYLHERPDTDNADRNAGDNDALGAKLYGTDYKACYAPSRTANTFERSDALGNGGNQSGFTFEFYQYENKHTGLDGVTTYNDREEEFQNPEENGSQQNTGIYKSLCEEATGGKNNMATYVEIQAKVTYYIDANGTPVNPNRASENGIMPRLGYAKYVVHLGYCEGTDAAKARDFNCRRNTRYTYRITINGVDKIRVEAEKEGDTPGAEGDVVDYESNSFYDLDCHYAVFNIQMSNAERNKLYWRLRAPYGTGEAKILDYNYNEAETMTDGASNRENPFYSWIRFRPTTNENTLATYSINESEMWTLQDLKDVANHPGNNGSTNVNNTTQQWYTVFVDEYAYLIDRNGQRLEATEWQDSAWENYVNQPDRTVWMIVDEDNYHLSYDEESLYAKTKYMISQRSIQTYYSTTILNGSKTALGVEHMNETYGKNLTWNWNQGESSLSHSNGRWNTWQYIQSGSQRNRWATILTATTPDAFYPVAALQSTTTLNNENNETNNPLYSQPAERGTYYEIIAACMSRNRDLNGNGTIDANELKWYLPAEGKYERIMLGRNALKSWLINPNADNNYYTIQSDPYAKEKVVPQLYTKLQSIVGPQGANGLPNWVHYASSDHRKFYPDEGGSYHPYLSIAWDPNQVFGYWPWNIRCVRNLGSTFETVTTKADSDPVERAYTFRANTATYTENGKEISGGVFDASSYHDDCLRANIDTYMPVHPVSNFQRNLIARYFEVSMHESVYTLGQNETMEQVLNENKPCRDYAQEADDADKGSWRAPNQRELMMILNESLSRENGDDKKTPILSNYGRRYSCTKEAYGNADRFAVIEGTTLMREPVSAGARFWVRCVRDVTSPTPQK